MAQTSINAIIAFKLKNVISKKIITPIIIGMMLPDLDFIIEYTISQFTFINYQIYNSIFHNIFMISYLLLKTLGMLDKILQY